MHKKKLFFSSLIFLFGCHKKNLKKELVQEKASHSVQELEARFVDIPLFPILFDLQVEQQSIVYRVHVSLEDIFNFYHSQCELLGWDETEKFSTDFVKILVLKKPAKRLCIIIESHQAHVKVQLFFHQ